MLRILWEKGVAQQILGASLVTTNKSPKAPNIKHLQPYILLANQNQEKRNKPPKKQQIKQRPAKPQVLQKHIQVSNKTKNNIQNNQDHSSTIFFSCFFTKNQAEGTSSHLPQTSSIFGNANSTTPQTQGV